MFEFTRGEIRDLIIAFILSFSFAISNVGMDAQGIISILPIVMFGVGIGFLLHELGHKYVAVKIWPPFGIQIMAFRIVDFIRHCIYRNRIRISRGSPL